MLPDGRLRPNVTWQSASPVGFEAIGVAISGVLAIRVSNVQVRTHHAVYADTLRFTPSQSLRGVSFTNPFTSLLPALGPYAVIEARRDCWMKCWTRAVI
jgi:hypothetical protein